MTKLSKIEDVTVDKVQGNNVTLSWQENPKAEKYAVYVYSADVKDFEELCVTESPYAVVTMGKYNTQYSFAVKAVAAKNKVDMYSDISDVAKATTAYPVPENIKVSEIRTASYKLTWDKIPDAVNYKIYKLKGDSYTVLATVSTNSYIVGNLSFGQIDKYKITAVYKEGTKKAESGFSAEVMASTLPAQVKTLKATAGTDSVKLTWSEVANADYYNIYQFEDDEYVYLTTVTGESYEVKGLQSGADYEFAVRAYIRITDSDIKGNATTVKATTKPEKVTSVKVSDAKTDGHTLSWSKAKGANYYHIYRYSSDEGKYVVVAKTNKLTYTFTGLSAGKTYSYKIKAVYMKNNVQQSISDFSAVYKFATTPAKVTELKSSSVTTNSFKLTWKKVSGATKYQVSVYDADVSQYVTYTTTDTNSVTIKNLSSKSTTKVKVRAIRVVGEKNYYGFYSSTLSVKTK